VLHMVQKFDKYSQRRQKFAWLSSAEFSRQSVTLWRQINSILTSSSVRQGLKA
jgi:hypothetical protein